MKRVPTLTLLLLAACRTQALPAAANDLAVGGEPAISPGPPTVANDLAVGADLSSPSDMAYFHVDGGGAKFVFLSSMRFGPALGGLAGADSRCQALADSVQLGGTYLAWLSDNVQWSVTRMSHATVPYIVVTGEVVANDWDDLMMGIHRPINITERGETIFEEQCDVFSDTLYLSGGRNDSSWNGDEWRGTPGSQGAWGTSKYSGNSWSSSCGGQACDGMQSRLFCFEQ